jgi:hypothetical protein
VKPAPFISQVVKEHTIESAARLLEGMEIVVISVDADPLDSYPLKVDSKSAQ